MKVKMAVNYFGWASYHERYPKNSTPNIPTATAMYLERNGWAKPSGRIAIKATDEAVDLAIRDKVDITKIKGSGEGNRVLVSDVKAAVDARPDAA